MTRFLDLALGAVIGFAIVIVFLTLAGATTTTKAYCQMTTDNEIANIGCVLSKTL